MNNLEKTKIEQNLKNIESFPLTGPVLDEAFYVFAVRVCSENSTGKRKLIHNKLYYLLDGFTVDENRILVSKERYNKTIYDYYVKEDKSSSPHISVTAIVGENGAGKSSLIEFEMRLINNFAAVLFGEYPKEKKLQHLHFIDGVDGELFYLLKQKIYRLKVSDRLVNLYEYSIQDEEEDNCYVFKSAPRPVDIIEGGNIPQDGTPIKRSYKHAYYISRKYFLEKFFYTVVFNQSVYAYNTRDFDRECNSEELEITVRGCRKENKEGKEVPYSTEDRCWLGGLFHKNDGYQIPIVITPFRFEGNYDINTENKLAYERLVSVLVREEASERVINGHLRVTSFELTPKKDIYDLEYIHENIGYSHLNENDFQKMREILLSCWNKHLGYDVLKQSKSFFYRKQAVNYLVYKTLKVANTYDEYREFHKELQNNSTSFDETKFALLVENTISNYSHVTSKLFRTVAYLIWDIYEKKGGNEIEPLHLRIEEINERWVAAFQEKKHDLTKSIFSELILEASVPPPFFETSIGMVDIKSGVYIPFKYLSSGEKQQVYTTSSIAYHLKNLDSVSKDWSTKERVAYENVQLILEEVELYYHPELQRKFVRNLLEGIKQAGLSHIKWINICIVTHSPFVLSDIPAGNVLALKKDDTEVGKIPCFGANIHEMLKMSFFLENGAIGDFAKWTTTRIAKCLRISRWINGVEPEPAFFKTLDDIPKEYRFIEEFETIMNGMKFSKEGFNLIYSPDVILSQINLIEEPIIRRVLLDDYKRTFPEKAEDYKKSMLALLEEQMKEFKD